MTTSTIPTADTTTKDASTSPSLIVTSGASRSNYADNVNTMNQATASLTNTNATTSTANSYTPLRDYLTSTGQAFSEANLQTLAKAHGMTNYSMSDQDNATLAGLLKTTPAKDSQTSTSTQTTSQPSKPVDVFAPTASGAKVTGSTANTDGSMTVNYDDGSQSRFVKDASGNYQSEASSTGTEGDSSTGSLDAATLAKNTSIDPSILKAYTDSVGNLDKGIQQAKDALDQARANLDNDPAAISAVNAIQAKYDQQIQLMKDKNSMLLGSYRTNAARNGSLQYANDMYSNFMSEEQDRATQRITDLITQETQLILKTQQAYKDGDVKELAAATKAYQDANKEKIDAINKLLTATNNNVKTMQAQAKIEDARAKQETTDNLRVSTGIAKTVADTITQSGVTDPAKIDQYISAMAEKNGITNPDVLRAAVVKARQDAEKFDLSTENTKSQIADRTTRTNLAVKKSNKNGPSSSGTLKTVEKNTIGNAFDQGDTVYGTKYNGRGPDGFVDPDLYTTIYNAFEKTDPAKAQSFIKAYPPEKNLNPEAATNPNLPEPIKNRLVAKATKDAKKTTSVDINAAKAAVNSHK